MRSDCLFCRYWWNYLNHLFITSSLWVVKSLNVIVNVKSKDVYDIVHLNNRGNNECRIEYLPENGPSRTN